MFTYYKQWGNKIFYSHIDENGLLRHAKIDDYKPKLFINTNDETDYKSIYGYNLKPIEFDTIKEAKNFIEKYHNVDGMKVEGNSKFANQFVIELNEGKEPKFDPSKIRGCIIDIEVTSPEFPKPIEAKYPIDLISIYDTLEKKYYCFSLYDYDHKNDETEAGSLNVEHIKYDSDIDLLRSFIEFIKNKNFNFISGWNSTGFDIPYLVKRITNVIGKETANRLSPFNIVNAREGQDQYGIPTFTAKIIGLPDIDYMLLYKKHIYTPRENYKLNYISQVELGKEKLSYEEEGSLFNLAKINSQKFTSYNLIDVKRIVDLENKLALFPLTYTLAYYCLVNYDDTLVTVTPWESLIAKELYKRGMIPLAKQDRMPLRDYPGGYVAAPIIGRHEWIATFDLNSLYPHIEMQIGISPETRLPRDKLPLELLELQNKLAVVNPDLYYEQCQNLVNKEIDLSVLKKYNVSMAANGQFYRKDVKGIIPSINEEVYNNRKKYKKEMLKVKRDLENIKDKESIDYKKLSDEVTRLNNLQMAMKILLNSGYGALACEHFLYFLVENAEAITTTGQVVNMWTSKRVNNLLNTILENDTKKDYIAYGDTDSVMFNLSDVVNQLNIDKSNFNLVTDNLDEFLNSVISPCIDRYTNDLCDYLNNIENKMVWEREIISPASIFTAKKHYVMLVQDSEGVRYKTPTMKIVGLESKKSNTPTWAKKYLEQCYELCLYNKKEEFHNLIKEIENEIIKNIPISDIAIPSGVNGIEKYVTDRLGYIKGTTKQAKAAINHNRLIKELGLNHINEIKSGSNIKYISLKRPNPINEDVIGFEGYLPKEFGLEKYIDTKESYHRGFEKIIRGFVKSIDWDIEEVVSLF